MAFDGKEPDVTARINSAVDASARARIRQVVAAKRGNAPPVLSEAATVQQFRDELDRVKADTEVELAKRQRKVGCQLGRLPW